MEQYIVLVLLFAIVVTYCQDTDGCDEYDSDYGCWPCRFDNVCISCWSTGLFEVDCIACTCSVHVYAWVGGVMAQIVCCVCCCIGCVTSLRWCGYCKPTNNRIKNGRINNKNLSAPINQSDNIDLIEKVQTSVMIAIHH
eukprot:239178_1